MQGPTRRGARPVLSIAVYTLLVGHPDFCVLPSNFPSGSSGSWWG